MAWNHITGSKRFWSPLHSSRRFSNSVESTISRSFSSEFSDTYSNPFSNTIDHQAEAEAASCRTQTDDWQVVPAKLLTDSERGETWLKMFYDFVIVTIPVLLLIKVALVIAAWHADRDHKGSRVDQASQLTISLLQVNGQMVTVFTVVFVTIMTTVLQRYALYKAQEGAYIPELEQLQGSVSPLATMKIILSLRMFNAASFALLVIWSFYYLGSQANKLEYRYSESERYQHLTAVTPRNKSVSAFSLPESDVSSAMLGRVEQVGFVAENHYNSAAQPGTDATGYALIPDLQTLLDLHVIQPHTSIKFKPDADGWLDVSKQSQIFDVNGYSGKMGWPQAIYNGSEYVAFVTHDRYFGDFTISPTYLSIDCSLPTLQPDDTFPPNAPENQTFSFRMTNITDSTLRDADGYPQRGFEFWLRPGQESTPFVSNTSMTLCNISQVFVDLHVNCQPTGCFPRAMRWLNGADVKAATSYNTCFSDASFASRFFDIFVQYYDAPETIGFGSTLQNRLFPLFQSTPASTIEGCAEAEACIQAQLHQLFTIYFNTWAIASQATRPGMNFSKDWMDMIPFYGALYMPQYAIYWEWVVIDIVSCSLLLAAAIFSVVLRARTLAPDILGTVSSLTREDLRSDMPDYSTTLSGLERARLMRHVKIRIGNVGEEGDKFGRVGLIRVDAGGGVCDRPLDKTVKYC